MANIVLELYEKYGQTDYIGEKITQTEHAIQCALVAKNEGYNDYVIIGALLHDIGHLIGLQNNLEEMDSLGTSSHENIGYEFLKKYNFPTIICDLVKNHISAKRYLVSKHPEYYNKLSNASKQTLIYQGGSMTKEEMKEYELNPNFELYLKLREWDDKAKVENMELPNIREFENIIKKCLSS